MTWWKPRSKLEAVSRATARVPDVSIGEPGWRERLYQSVTDRTRRENAIQAAKLGATAAIVPAALGALAYQRAYWRESDHKVNIAEAAKDTAKVVRRAGLGAAAGAAGGFVAGPIGGIAAAVAASTTIGEQESIKDRRSTGYRDGERDKHPKSHSKSLFDTKEFAKVRKESAVPYSKVQKVQKKS